MFPSLLAPIQQGLIPIVLLLALLGALECVLYILKSPFYFRLGPTLHRERWQAAAPPAAVWSALRAALPNCKQSVRDGGSILCFRRPWWALSAYPRATLRVIDDVGAAILVYEVKPFIGMAPFAIVFLLTALGGFAGYTSIVVVILIASIYFLCWRYELKKLARLECLRRHLRCVGVLVCTPCGYDLFRREEHQPCPECGTVPADQAGGAKAG